MPSWGCCESKIVACEFWNGPCFLRFMYIPHLSLFAPPHAEQNTALITAKACYVASATTTHKYIVRLLQCIRCRSSYTLCSSLLPSPTQASYWRYKTRKIQQQQKFTVIQIGPFWIGIIALKETPGSAQIASKPKFRVRSSFLTPFLAAKTWPKCLKVA